MSYGEQILEQYFELMLSHSFIRNHRPDWLNGLELDFYFEHLRLGVEFQGDHHYIATDYSPDVAVVLQRDKEKKTLCRRNKVRLLTLHPFDLHHIRLGHKLRHLKMDLLLRNRKKSRVKRLNQLNQKAIEYRRTLKTNYDSVVCLNAEDRKREVSRRIKCQHWLANLPE